MLTQIFINGLIAGSVYTLIALGFSIIFKTIRFFHLAHGAVYTSGAYFAYTASIKFGLNVILSFFLAATLATLLGVAIDRFVYLPLRKKKSPDLVFLLASFGVFIFLQNFFQLFFGAQILTLRLAPVKEGYHFAGSVITSMQLFIISASIMLFIILSLILNRTKIGKAIRAVSDDPIGATVSGIWSERIIIYAFVIGSMLAGMAGVLVSFETNIEPTMGFNAILKGIIASIIGGVGSIPGAILGGFFLGIIENFGIWKIQSGWKDAIAFSILIIFLLFRPQGILSSKKVDRI